MQIYEDTENYESADTPPVATPRMIPRSVRIPEDTDTPEDPERQRRDRKYMRAAIHQAERAAACGEVPIGCVIVCDDKIVGRGFNQRNTKHTTLAHAELTAIDRASRKIGDWRLEGCTLYVTLEPCQMCSGAIVQSRIDRVVMGTMNPKAGCAGSILNILQMPEFNHQVEITTGVRREECTAMLKTFFRELRIRNRREKEQASASATEKVDVKKPLTRINPVKS